MQVSKLEAKIASPLLSIKREFSSIKDLIHLGHCVKEHGYAVETLSNTLRHSVDTENSHDDIRPEKTTFHMFESFEPDTFCIDTPRHEPWLYIVIEFICVHILKSCVQCRSVSCFQGYPRTNQFPRFCQLEM